MKLNKTNVILVCTLALALVVASVLWVRYHAAHRWTMSAYNSDDDCVVEFRSGDVGPTFTVLLENETESHPFFNRPVEEIDQTIVETLGYDDTLPPGYWKLRYKQHTFDLDHAKVVIDVVTTCRPRRKVTIP